MAIYRMAKRIYVALLVTHFPIFSLQISSSSSN